jgi:hypothetical protein
MIFFGVSGPFANYSILLFKRESSFSEASGTSGNGTYFRTSPI